MRQIKGGSSVRHSEIGGMIESFLDDNTHYISEDLWDKLEELAGEIDEAALRLEKRIEELEEEE